MDLKKIKVDQLRYDETFVVDAVIWDMDGTLVDSIGAVEAAWGSVAEDLGRDKQEVIELTHGRRAIDNLRDLKPELASVPDADMDPHVEEFETKILNNADQYSKEVRSRRESKAESIRSSRRASRAGSREGSRPVSRSGSISDLAAASGKRKSSFAAEVAARMNKLSMTTDEARASPRGSGSNSPHPLNGMNGTLTPLTSKKVESPPSIVDDDPFEDDDDDDESIDIDSLVVDTSDLKDNSVQIMPSVRRLINCLPDGHWAVATSGAKTYCHGALSRVGITPPPVTITADDKRLKKGKPHPDPFLLAAQELGYDCKNCLVVEDSPSGIRAGVASGAKTIAVATSHPAEKIRDSGAHYLVPTLDCVTFEILPDLRIRVRILPEIAKATPPHVQHDP